MRPQVEKEFGILVTSLFRATHFITHSYTDYSLVNKWWHYGHEIASHSVTHRNDLDYWKGMTAEEFKAEAVGQRRITGQFAALDPCEIKGAFKLHLWIDLFICNFSRLALSLPPGYWRHHVQCA